jgi:hypothetical protein
MGVGAASGRGGTDAGWDADSSCGMRCGISHSSERSSASPFVKFITMGQLLYHLYELLLSSNSHIYFYSIHKLRNSKLI